MCLGETAFLENCLSRGIGTPSLLLAWSPVSGRAMLATLRVAAPGSPGTGRRRMQGLLTCGGQGRRSPAGGSRPAPGSSRTSPARCGTRLVAADPDQRAAPPGEQRVVPWDTLGPRGAGPGRGGGRGVRGGRERVGAEPQNSLQGP